MQRMLSLAVIAAIGLGSCLSQGLASELVYKPVNPSFGGNPFNSGHLLGIAEAQNDFKDPDDPFDDDDNPVDQFIRSLENRLLSGLASQVTDAIFGDNPQQSGTIVFGDQTITFDRGLENVTIEIIDNTTGTSTLVEVPILQVN